MRLINDIKGTDSNGNEIVLVTAEQIIDKIKSTGRTFECEIKVGENIYKEISNLKFKKPFSSNKKMSVGDALSGYIETDMLNCNLPLTNERIQVSLYLRLDEYGENLRYEFPLGKFNVQEPCEIDGQGTQKIIAYDDITKTDGVEYTPLSDNISFENTYLHICELCGITNQSYSQNAIEYLRELDEYFSVGGDFYEFDIIAYQDFLSGNDCRTVLGSLAALLGRQCICDYNGYITFATFTPLGTKTTPKHYIDLDEIDTFDFPVTKTEINRYLCTTWDGTTVEYGYTNSSSGLKYQNLFLSQNEHYYTNKAKDWNEAVARTIALTFGLSNLDNPENDNSKSNDTSSDDIWTLSYYPASFKQLSGDPRIDVGDLLWVQNRYYDEDNEAYDIRYSLVPVMDLEMEFDGGFSTKISAYEANSNLKTNADQYISQLDTKIDEQNTDFNARTESLNTFNDTIANALGLYVTEKKNQVSGSIKYYFHNQSDISQSTFIFTMNSDGFAWTDKWNDDKTVWENGISKDGNAILKTLYAYKISADLIESGKVVSKDGNTFFDLDNSLIVQKKEIEVDDNTKAIYETYLNAGSLYCYLSTDNKETAYGLGLGGTSIGAYKFTKTTVGTIDDLLVPTKMLWNMSYDKMQIGVPVEFIKNTESTEPSGVWTDVSTTSAVTKKIVTPQCCLRNEVVYVTGRVEVKMSSDTNGKVTIAKLPSGYRPKSNGLYKFVCAVGKTLARINIKPESDTTNAGDIVLEFVHNVASNTSVVNDTVGWVDLNFNFAL